MKTIYLDNAATTRPSDRAVSKMLPYLTDQWGAASSPHDKGQELFPAINESFEKIFTLLGGRDKFIFTSSGAEAVNHAIFSGYYDVTAATGKNQFLTSSTDEAPALMAIGRLERMGCVGKMIDTYPLNEEVIAEAITPRTAMISLSYANGLTGVIQPIYEVARVCEERGILLHLDITHVLGKLFFEIEDLGASFLSFNGENLHAPKGTGGLYIKKGVACSPFIAGSVEENLAVPSFIALGQSAKEAHESRDYFCVEVARLRNKFEEGIRQGFADAQVLFQDKERVPHISAIAFPGIVNEALLFNLNRQGLFASMGGGNFQQISHLVQKMGVEKSLSQTVLSFALSRETHEEEIDRAVSLIVDTAKKMQKMGRSQWD